VTDRSALPPEIRMGDDVSRAMAHLPRDEASEQIATHLRKFWEPRMREAIIQRVREGDDRVNPLLTSAVHDYLDGDIDREEVSEPSGG